MGDQTFIDCISLSKLIEPQFTDNFCTWRGGLNFTMHNKIDQDFVNSTCINQFKHFGIHFGYQSISDHTPISISFLLKCNRSVNVTFRYSNS